MALPYIRKLGHVAGQTVWLVSGEYVRNHIFLDFTQGGNDQVYRRFTPAGEVWIDDATGPFDQTATALHEIVERDQMLRRHLPYEKAHDIALSYERPFRRELAKRGKMRAIDLGAVARAYREYQTIAKVIGQ